MNGPISLDDILEARRRIAGWVVRTPLVRLNVPEAPADVYLKLENLQPVGAFKLRGAASRILALPNERLSEGVWTASSGNMGRAVAYCARQLGVVCTVVVPEDASANKVDNIRRLGAEVVPVDRDEFHATFKRQDRDGIAGEFVHPFGHPDVVAGNGTIGLEIADDLPEVDTVLAGYGGGGLACGIASALKAVAPGARVIACEPATAAPLTRAWEAGAPVPVPHHRSFVDGVGAAQLYPEMWTLARQVLDGSVAMPLSDIAAAVRLLADRNRIVAEGAGALPVAAALAGHGGTGTVCCVVSGGNIDLSILAAIIDGGFPEAQAPSSAPLNG